MNEDVQIRLEALAIAVKRDSNDILGDAATFYDFLVGKEPTNG